MNMYSNPSILTCRLHRHDTEDKDSFIPLEDIVESFANILANKKILPQWLGDLFKVHLRGKNGIRERATDQKDCKGLATLVLFIPANFQNVSKYIPDDFF